MSVNPDTSTTASETMVIPWDICRYGSQHISTEWRNWGATNLLDPYQNIHVGIDYISGLIEKYGTIQDALAAYNYGERGAYTHLWSNGIYVYEYNETIIQRMKEIEEELEQ